jgi:uncharacterized protein YbjT (DUF2867 family)
LRVLLTGATGLIGSAVLAGLVRQGHEVVAVVRDTAAGARLPHGVGCIALDIAAAREPQAWLGHLAGVDAVVNCAGVLQDSPRDSTLGVHVAGASALFAACVEAGVRRVVHVSALGVAADAPTAFARTKQAGDTALMRTSLDWVILRPSVVVGRAAYGGSALLRALAALPVLPSLGHEARLQIVQLDDLVATVLFFLAPGAPAQVSLQIVGPEALPLDAVLAAYRRWLGFGTTRILKVPAWLASVAFRLGDLAGLLGWRAPLRSTLARELARGVIGDPAEWTRLTGIRPQSLEAALAAEPASVQERWFARLYLLKPVALATLAFYWIATGLIALGPGAEEATRLLEEAGVGAAGPPTVAASLADVAIGVGIAVRRTARAALWAALALSLAYLAAGTLLLPSLWAEPLGPLLKIAPIAALIAVALATLDER